MKSIKKIKNLFLWEHFVEFWKFLHDPPKKYQNFKCLSAKITIRLQYDQFLDLYKKDLLPNNISLLDYFKEALSQQISKKNKKAYINHFLKHDKECLEELSDLDKVLFFDLLIDNDLGHTFFFCKLFIEYGIPTIEDIQSIDLIDKFLTSWMNVKLKFFHLEFSRKLIVFLLEINEANMDLLDDQKCLILLKINQKLRVLNLILPFGAQETKFLDKIEARLVELQAMENLTDDPEILSELLGIFAYLGYSVKNQDLLDYFEKILVKNFKTMNSKQIHNTLSFMLLTKQKQFLNLFYMQYLKGTSFHLQEYFNRILNIKKFELNFFKNLAMVASRFFLSSYQVFEPHYVKTFHFDIFHLGDLYYRFGTIESYNMSNLMVILRKHIISRLKYLYEYKFRKNINMEYKLHEFWIKILQYYDCQLSKKYFYILDENEPKLIFGMALNYTILNLKYFDLENLMLLYSLIGKFQLSPHKNKQIEQEKIELIKYFIDEKCISFLKNRDIQSFYVYNQPKVLLYAVKQGVNLEKKEMIESVTLIQILTDFLPHFNEYDDVFIKNFVELMEIINENPKQHDLMKILIIKIIDEKIDEKYFIKNFETLSTSLLIFLEFYCNLQKYERIHPGHFEKTLLKIASSINLLIRKLLFLDAAVIDENKIIIILRILNVIEEKYLKSNHSIAKEFETLTKFCFRFISDRHNKFSYEGLEKIVETAFNLQASSQKFDDGSGLYDKFLMEEIDPYLEEKWKKFSEKFRNYWNEIKIKSSEKS